MLSTDKRIGLFKAALQKVNQKDAPKNGTCALCLNDSDDSQFLTKSHITSNGLLKSFYGLKKTAVHIFHDVPKSSTDDFYYLLFCSKCENLFAEAKTVPKLKKWSGLEGLSLKKPKDNEISTALLYRFIVALFMRQIGNHLAQCDFFDNDMKSLFKTSVDYILCDEKDRRSFSSPPKVSMLVTKLHQNIWTILSLNQNERESLFLKVLTRKPYTWLNYQVCSNAISCNNIKL